MKTQLYYRLPGGTERVINTKSTTVVTDIIEELCNVIGVNSVNEREEFSLYCIVEGETFTVPLAKDHYILDVTTGIVVVIVVVRNLGQGQSYRKKCFLKNTEVTNNILISSLSNQEFFENIIRQIN
jgi:hypothetical protein